MSRCLLIGFATAVIYMGVIWVRCANLLYNKQHRFLVWHICNALQSIVLYRASFSLSLLFQFLCTIPQYFFFILSFDYFCPYVITLFSAVNNYLFTLYYSKFGVFFNYQMWINVHFHTHVINLYTYGPVCFFTSHYYRQLQLEVIKIWRYDTYIPAHL